MIHRRITEAIEALRGQGYSMKLLKIEPDGEHVFGEFAPEIVSQRRGRLNSVGFYFGEEALDDLRYDLASDLRESIWSGWDSEG